jgi:excisionase family DNA binding protein
MEMINIEDYKDSTLAKMSEQKKQTVPIEAKVALTIKEAAEYSNIGINKIESLLRTPRCPFVLYVGKKKLVKRKEFEKFIADNIEI